MNRYAIAIGRTIANVPIKIKVSFCILSYAIAMAIAKNRPDSTCCVFAVLFCFSGDVALNHKKEHKQQTNTDFKIGMIMFMVAHILYITTYFLLIQREYSDVIERGANWFLFLIVDSLLLFGIAEVLYERIDFGKYKIVILVYMLIITSSFTMTFCYANIAKSFSSLACVGAAALVISDLIIAFEKFAHYETHKTRMLVWITYVVGQLLIITFA